MSRHDWPGHADNGPRFEHGHFEPGRGYYDASRRAWVDKPEQVTKTVYQAPAARPMQGLEFRTSTISTAEAAESAAAQTFRPSSEMEALRRLRTTDPTAFGQLVSGPRRISLASYEEGLAAHLRAGGELPDGVTPPAA